MDNRFLALSLALFACSSETTTAPANLCVDTVVSAQNDLSHVKGGVIAFGRRDPQGNLQIFTAKPDGSELRQLTFEGQSGLADWSPDGKRLTFMAMRQAGASSA